MFNKDDTYKIPFKIFKEVMVKLIELKNGNAFEIFRNATSKRATKQKKVC